MIRNYYQFQKHKAVKKILLSFLISFFAIILSLGSNAIITNIHSARLAGSIGVHENDDGCIGDDDCCTHGDDDCCGHDHDCCCCHECYDDCCYDDVEYSQLYMAGVSTWNGLMPTSVKEFTNGVGTAAQPFLITSAADLAQLSYNVNNGAVAQYRYSDKYFKLTTNIDLANRPWTPIGNTSRYFAGNFDGDGNNISRLYYHGSTYNYVGLFGYIKSTVTNTYIKKLDLDYVDINSNKPDVSLIGALVGMAQGYNIEDIAVSGYITNAAANSSSNSFNVYVGGIAGVTIETNIRYCYVKGSIANFGGASGKYDTGRDTSPSGYLGYRYTGGIAGQRYNGTFDQVYSVADINSVGSFTHLYEKQEAELTTLTKTIKCSGHTETTTVGEQRECNGHPEYNVKIGEKRICNGYDVIEYGARWRCKGHDAEWVCPGHDSAYANAHPAIYYVSGDGTGQYDYVHGHAEDCEMKYWRATFCNNGDSWDVYEETQPDTTGCDFHTTEAISRTITKYHHGGVSYNWYIGDTDPCGEYTKLSDITITGTTYHGDATHRFDYYYGGSYPSGCSASTSTPISYITSTTTSYHNSHNAGLATLAAFEQCNKFTTTNTPAGFTGGTNWSDIVSGSQVYKNNNGTNELISVRRYKYTYTPQSDIYAIGYAGAVAGNSNLKSGENAFYNNSKPLLGDLVTYKLDYNGVNIGRSAADLKDLDTYHNWLNFDTHWMIETGSNPYNEGYPFLKALGGYDYIVNTRVDGLAGGETTPYFSTIKTQGSGTYNIANDYVTVSYYVDSYGGYSSLIPEDLGYVFSHWEHNGVTIEGNGTSIYVGSPTSENRGTYTAVFVKREFNVGVAIKIEGDIADNSDSKLGSMSGNGIYKVGNSISLQYNVAANNDSIGYNFAYWEREDLEEFDRGVDWITDTVDFDWIREYSPDIVYYYANLEYVHYNLVVEKEGSGNTTKNLNTAIIGDTINVNAIANIGNRFIRWEILKNDGTSFEPVSETGAYSKIIDTDFLKSYSYFNNATGTYEIKLKAIFRKELTVSAYGLIDNGQFSLAGNTAILGLTPQNVASSSIISYVGQTLYVSIVRTNENMLFEGEFTLFVSASQKGDPITVTKLAGYDNVYSFVVTGESNYGITACFYRKQLNIQNFIFNKHSEVSGNNPISYENYLISPFEFLEVTISTNNNNNTYYLDVLSIHAKIKNDYKNDFEILGIKSQYNAATFLISASNSAEQTFDFVLNNNFSYYLIVGQKGLSISTDIEVVSQYATPNDNPGVSEIYYNGNLVPSGYVDLGFGESVTIKAKANTHYSFVKFKYLSNLTGSQPVDIPSGQVVLIGGYYVLDITGFSSAKAGRYTAVFTKDLYLMSVEEYSKGTVLINGSSTADVYINQTIDFTVSPIAGYRFLHLSITPDGTAITINSITTDILALADADKKITLYAVYIEQYSLLVNYEANTTIADIDIASSNESVSFNNLKYFDKDTMFEINFSIKDLKVYQLITTGLNAGELNVTNNRITIILTANRDISLEFRKILYSVTVSLNEGFGNTATITGAGNYEYNNPAEIVLSGLLNGYYIKNWEIKNSGGVFEPFLGENILSHRFLVQKNVEIRINIDNIFTVSISTGNAGGVVSPESRSVKNGTKVNIIATPNAGYLVDYWTVNSNRISAYDNQANINIDVDQNMQVKVYFKNIKYRVNVSALEVYFEKNIGYTINTPHSDEAGSYYHYNESVIITLNIAKSKMPLKFNNLKANGTVRTANTSGEYVIVVNSGSFVNNVCTISVDVQMLYNIKVYKNDVRAADVLVNTSANIVLKETNPEQLYSIYEVVEGYTIILKSSANIMFRFGGYYSKLTQEDEYAFLTSSSQLSLVVVGNVILLADFDEIKYGLSITEHLNDNSNVDINFNGFKYSILNKNGEEVDSIAVDDEISIKCLSVPFGYEFVNFTDTNRVVLANGILRFKVITIAADLKMTIYIESIGNIVLNNQSGYTLFAIFSRKSYSVTATEIKIGDLIIGNITGANSYKIGDTVTLQANITLEAAGQVIKSGIVFTDWMLAANIIPFDETNNARYKDMDFFRYYSSNLWYNRMQFVFVPNFDMSSYTFSVGAEFIDYSVTTTLNRIVGSRLYAFDSDEDDVATVVVQSGTSAETLTGSGAFKNNIHVRDVLKIIVTFNTAYETKYELLGIYKLKYLDLVQDGNVYTYTLSPFLTGNSGAYSIRFGLKQNDLMLVANPEEAVQYNEETGVGTLFQNQDTYTIGDTVEIGVIEGLIVPGYKFVGWYQRKNDTETFITIDLVYSFEFTNETADVVMVAKFEPINYTFDVSVKNNTGGTVSTYNLLDGSLIDAKGTLNRNITHNFMLIFNSDFANGYILKALNVKVGVSGDVIDYLFILNMDSDRKYGEFVFNLTDLTSFDGRETIFIEAVYDLKEYAITIRSLLDGMAVDNDILHLYTLNVEGYESEYYNPDGVLTYNVKHGNNLTILLGSTANGFRLATMVFGDIVIRNFDDATTFTNIVEKGGIIINIDYIYYTLTLLKNFTNAGQVTITNQYGIATNRFRVGDIVMFNVTQLNNDYFFSRYEYKGNTISSGSKQYSFYLDFATDGYYTYDAIFEAKSILISSVAYEYKQFSSPVPIMEGGSIKKAAVLKVNIDGTLQDVSEYLYKVNETLTFRILPLTGYEVLNVYLGDTQLDILSGGVYNIELTANYFSNETLDIKVVYTIKYFSIIVKTNFTGLKDINNNNISPADVKFTYQLLIHNSNVSYSFPFKSNIQVNIESIKPTYTYLGIFINGVKINTGNNTYADYILTENTEIFAVFAPKITFVNFTDFSTQSYIRNYNGQSYGVDLQNISVAEELKPFLKVMYNSSLNAPLNAGVYDVVAYIDLDGIRDYKTTAGTVTYRINQIVLHVVLADTLIKEYDGTKNVIELKGFAIAAGQVSVNDAAFIKLYLGDATAAYMKNGFENKRVGNNLDIMIYNLKLSVTMGSKEYLLQNYVLEASGNMLFASKGQITPKIITLTDIRILDKVYDGNSNVLYASTHDPQIKAGSIINGDNVVLNYSQINYTYSSSEVGENLTASAYFSGTGLSGADAANYQLQLPTFTKLKIHPYELVYTNENMQTFKIIDINRNVYLPINANFRVFEIPSTTREFSDIYELVENKLSSNKYFAVAYKFIILSNNLEYKLNGTVKIVLSTPSLGQSEKVEEVISFIDGNLATISGESSGSTYEFFDNKSGIFIIIASRNPLPVWLIIVIVISVVAVLTLVSIYIFVILPKKRQKAIAKWGKVE